MNRRRKLRTRWCRQSAVRPPVTRENRTLPRSTEKVVIETLALSDGYSGHGGVSRQRAPRSEAVVGSPSTPGDAVAVPRTPVRPPFSAIIVRTLFPGTTSPSLAREGFVRTVAFSVRDPSREPNGHLGRRDYLSERSPTSHTPPCPLFWRPVGHRFRSESTGHTPSTLSAVLPRKGGCPGQEMRVLSVLRSPSVSSLVSVSSPAPAE